MVEVYKSFKKFKLSDDMFYAFYVRAQRNIIKETEKFLFTYTHAQTTGEGGWGTRRERESEEKIGNGAGAQFFYLI